MRIRSLLTTRSRGGTPTTMPLTTVFCLLALLPSVHSMPPSPKHELVFYRSSLFPVQPPHCTKTPITISSPSMSAHQAIHREIQHMSFDIGLHTTVCFRLDDEKNVQSASTDNSSHHSSWLHTIRLDKLEHHHPVTQQYIFGIPEVKADCICECSHSEKCNAQNYKYTYCPQEDYDNTQQSCYRTFFPDQSPTGCSAGSNPSLCCDLKFRPYRNQSYMAVMVEQPSTFATFIYTAYDYQAGRWVEMDRSVIRSQLDGGTQDKFLDALRRLELSVSAGGRASHQLETGMYFAPSNKGGEMDELRKMPLNEVSEYNYERLGWYREEKDGHFRVFNGPVRLDKVHNAKTISCKEQTFISTLDANHYMPDHFNLSRPLERLHPWIERARLYDGKARSVVVTHAEGTNLRITLRVTGESHNRLVFFHNASKIEDFSGSIIVDSRSNRYFNVTLYSASGKINGVVKVGVSKGDEELHSFTTYVNDLEAVNKSMIIPLPATIEEGTRMVCLRADEQREETQICKVVEYHESALEVDIDENSWREGVGNCPDCNKVNLDNVINYLNPLRWAKGVSDIGEFVVMIGDVVIYVGILFLLYHLITKVIIPVCQCCNWCFSSLPERREKPSKRDTKSGVTHLHVDKLTIQSPAVPSMAHSTCHCAECLNTVPMTPPPRYGSDEGVEV